MIPTSATFHRDCFFFGIVEQLGEAFRRVTNSITRYGPASSKRIRRAARSSGVIECGNPTRERSWRGRRETRRDFGRSSTLDGGRRARFAIFGREEAGKIAPMPPADACSARRSTDRDGRCEIARRYTPEGRRTSNRPRGFGLGGSNRPAPDRRHPARAGRSSRASASRHRRRELADSIANAETNRSRSKQSPGARAEGREIRTSGMSDRRRAERARRGKLGAPPRIWRGARREPAGASSDGRRRAGKETARPIAGHDPRNVALRERSDLRRENQSHGV